MKLWLRKIIGSFARELYPNYSWCKRCKRPWNICKDHSVMYSERAGCFALCKDCWGELTSEERLPYYLWLVDSWSICGHYHGMTADEIKNALRENILNDTSEE